MNKKEQITERLVGEARKSTPWSPRCIVFYILAIIYVLSPIDIVPDALIGAGQVDDGIVILSVILYVIRMLRKK